MIIESRCRRLGWRWQRGSWAVFKCGLPNEGGDASPSDSSLSVDGSSGDEGAQDGFGCDGASLQNGGGSKPKRQRAASAARVRGARGAAGRGAAGSGRRLLLVRAPATTA